MRRELTGTVAIAAIALVSGMARGVELPDDDTKSLPCRPTIACTADVVAPGLFELETGMLFRRLAGARQWSFPFLAKQTLTSFAQLQVGSNGVTTLFDGASGTYFDDVSAGVKLHLLDQSSWAPSLSFSGAVAFPVAEPTGGPGGYFPGEDAFFIAYVTKDLGPVHADLNLGLSDWGLESGTRGQEWLALALSAALPAPFGVMAENYYFTSAAPFATRDGGLLFAFSVSPRPWLVFDFGGDIGYFRDDRSYSAFVGMTLVPLRLWR